MKRKMANQPIDYEICDMNFRHIEEVVKIEKLSFNTAWTRSDFISELEVNKTAKYRVLITNEHVVAYGGMWVLLDEAHVTNIAVHPEYRGVGLGKAILKDLINTAAKNGASSMTLEVRKGNNVAINLYKKFGFIEEGIRKKYYADTGDDAIIMWKYDLESSDS